MKLIIVILLCFSNITFAKTPTLEQQYQLNLRRGLTAENATKYPLILHHGLFGFKKLLFIEYFHQIPKTLRNAGFTVYVTQAYMLGDLKQKSRELADQVDQILKMTGKDKVNIIAHSMGGLDTRMMISQLGYEDKIASLSMIGTPNRGSYIADLISGLANSKQNEKETQQLTNILGKLFITTDPNKNLIEDTLSAIGDLTQKYVREEFNPKNPDSPKVYYQSWAGRTGTIIDPNFKDLVDPLLTPTYAILKKHDGENDGMVSTESAKWGNFRGVLEADHLDMTGFWFGATSQYFNHKRFYLNLAQELADMGF